MATDPNQGASQSRAEELRQANIEGAKFKATMEGLNSVFKEFKKTSGETLRKDADLLAQLDGLGKGFKKAMGLADKLKGFTVEDLKNAKLRNQFQNNLTAAQGDLARVDADIVLLKEKQVTLDAQARQAAEDRLKLIEKQIPLGEELGDLQETEHSITEEIKKLQEEINKQRQNGKIGEEEINKKLRPRLELAQKDLDLTKAAFAEKKKIVDGLDDEIQAQEGIIEQSENQAKIISGIVKEAENYKTTIDGTVDAATELSKKIDEVNNATPAFIEAFEKFGEIAGQIPIVGSAISLMTGEISKASKMFKDLKAEGKSSASAIMQAFKGFTIATLTASLAAFVKLAIDGAKKASEAIVTLNKSVAGSMVNMSAQMGKTASAAAKYGVPLQAAAETVAGLNEHLGTSLDFTTETTNQAVKLANKYGVGGDAVAHLLKLSAAQHTTMTDMVDSITSGVSKFNALNGVSISTKAVMEDIGSASATTLRNLGHSPQAIVKAAAAARALGMSMDDINEAARSTLDFQDSMAAEMEAELMLGKELNLDRLRAAAATGDTATQAAEMKRLVMENADAIGNNVLAQEKFAATLGISREQYNEMLETNDALGVLTGKSGAAQQANDKARKMSQEEIARSIESTTSKLTKLADKIANFQEQMALGANSFAMGIINGFDDGFFAGIKNIGKMIGDEFGKMTESGFSNYIKSGSNVGKLLGVLGVGGAGVLTLKAASGLGKSLFGGFKLFGKADGSSPTKGLWVRNAGDSAKSMFDKIASKLGGGGGNDLVKSASSPTGFRDKMGRFAKAPAAGKAAGGAAGGLGGGLAGLGKGIGKFAKGIGKGIEGIFKGLAGGLRAFANPAILEGAAILAGAITIIGASIAAAGWMLGKTLPTFAEGLSAIADLDGMALLKAGAGIAAVGAGMYAMGAGQIAGAIGSLVGGISALFGGDNMDSMFKKVEKFGKDYTFDPVKLENNARGVVAYAGAMAALAVGSAGSTFASVSGIMGSLVDGITGFLGGDLPMDKVQKFGTYDLNADKIGNNAKAVAFYAMGMAALAGGTAGSTVASLGNIVGGLADGIVGLLGGDLPMDKVQKFGTYDLDPKKTFNNAKAVANYAMGMAALAGGTAGSTVASLGNIVGGLADGIVGLLGGDLPMDKVKKFGEYDLDPEKTFNNSKAVGAYALGMAALAGGSAANSVAALGNLAGSLADGIVGLFGGDLPMDKVKKFGEYDLDPEKIGTNSKAVVNYAMAMSALAGSQAAGVLGSLANVGTQLFEGIAGAFGADTGIPYDKIRNLQEAGLDGDKVSKNATALAAYAKAMGALAASNAGGYLGALGNAGKQLVDGVVGFFGGSTGIPYDEIKKFANQDIDEGKLLKNSTALAKFGEAMSQFEDFDDYTDDFDDGIGDLRSGIKSFNKLGDIDQAKVAGISKAAKSLAKLGEINMDNVGSILKDLATFSRTLGYGALKVDVKATTLFETEIESLRETLNTTSDNEVAELRKQNEEIRKAHREEMKQLKSQTTIMYNVLTADQKKTVIKMDSYKVAESLVSRF